MRAALRRAATRCTVLLIASGVSAAPLCAQQDTAQVLADSVRATVVTRQAALRGAQGAGPPITPVKAFLTSFAVPGLAQSKFDRGSAGALFVAIELGALAMVKRSNDQVREARRFLNDSLPTDFAVGPDGVLTPVGISSGGFSRELIRRRKLHVEDWIAVVAFNHLLSGADAFVSAQLWDLPTALSVYPARGGAVVAASIQW